MLIQAIANMVQCTYSWALLDEQVSGDATRSTGAAAAAAATAAEQKYEQQQQQQQSTVFSLVSLQPHVTQVCCNT
jgi:hypothetical protein